MDSYDKTFGLNYLDLGPDVSMSQVLEAHERVPVQASFSNRPQAGAPVKIDKVYQSVAVSSNFETTTFTTNPRQQFMYTSSVSQHHQMTFETASSFMGNFATPAEHIDFSTFPGGLTPSSMYPTLSGTRSSGAGITQRMAGGETQKMQSLLPTFPNAQAYKDRTCQLPQTGVGLTSVNTYATSHPNFQVPQNTASTSQHANRIELPDLNALIDKDNAAVDCKKYIKSPFQAHPDEVAGCSNKLLSASKDKSLDCKQTLLTNHISSDEMSSACIEMIEKSLMRSTGSHEDYIKKWVEQQYIYTKICQPTYDDEETFHLSDYLHISSDQFEHLVSLIEPLVKKDNERLQSLLAYQRLSITLNYLLTGEFHSGKPYMVPLTKREVFHVITTVCVQLYKLLKDDYLYFPTDPLRLALISKQLAEDCTFLPNCFGTCSMWEVKCNATATGERRGAILYRQPLIMTTVVDAKHNFLFIKIEQSNAREWQKLYNESEGVAQITEKMTEISKLYKSDEYTPYFVASHVLPNKSFQLSQFNPKVASGLHSNMTDCFQETCDKVNAHGSNAIRMMVNIFPVLQGTLRMCDEHATKIVLGCVALYNFLRQSESFFFNLSETINNGNGNKEDTPFIISTSCFREVPKQKGDDYDALQKRDKLMHDIYTKTLKGNLCAKNG